MLKQAAVWGIFILLLMSCASQKMWYGDAKDGFCLRHQITPADTATFFINTSITDSMHLMGKKIRSNTVIRSQLSQQVTAAPNKKNKLLLVGYDSIDFTSDNQSLQPILPTINDAMKGFLKKKFKVELKNTGITRLIASFDSLLPPRLQSFLNPQETITFIYQDLPEKKIRLGEHWESANKYLRKTPDMNLRFSRKAICLIDSILYKDSEEILKISFHGECEVKGRERQLNIIGKVQGKGEFNGHFLFAYQRGKYLEGHFQQQMKMDYFLPGVESMPLSKRVDIATEIRRE